MKLYRLTNPTTGDNVLGGDVGEQNAMLVHHCEGPLDRNLANERPERTVGWTKGKNAPKRDPENTGKHWLNLEVGEASLHSFRSGAGVTIAYVTRIA